MCFFLRINDIYFIFTHFHAPPFKWDLECKVLLVGDLYKKADIKNINTRTCMCVCFVSRGNCSSCKNL